jgi:hypothetical protein
MQRADNSVEEFPSAPQGTDANASQPPKAEEPADINEFVVRDNTTDQVIAAAAMVGLGTQGGPAAPAELGIMKAGHVGHLWVLSEIESAIPLRTRTLRGITDSQGVASGLKGTRADTQEYEAYVEALNKANATPAFAFANSARRDVSYANLMTEPHAFRGDVVHIEGRLKRVYRFNPPIAATNVRDLYEGWIFGGERGANPVCLVFTQLPEGLQVGDQKGVKVAFDGYFFKRYRFKADDSGPNQAREAPLLIGRTLILLETPVATTDGASGGDASSLLIGFLALIALTALLAVGLTWWFRRSDRRIRSRLAGAMARDFQAPLPDGDEPIAHGLDQTPLPYLESPPARFPLDANDPKSN